MIPGVANARRRLSLVSLPTLPSSSSVILIHGWFSTASALKRFGASFTKSPRIKSFASWLTSPHSLSGKLNRPLNKKKKIAKNWKELVISNAYLLESIQIIILDRYDSFHHDSSRNPVHSYPRMVGNHKAEYKQWPQGTISHIVCRSDLLRQQITQPLLAP